MQHKMLTPQDQQKPAENVRNDEESKKGNIRKISIIRPKSAYGMALKYTAILDDKQKLGVIKNDSRIDLELDENDHKILFKVTADNSSKAYVGCMITQKLLDPQFRARISEASHNGRIKNSIQIYLQDDDWEMRAVVGSGVPIMDEIICREAYLQDPGIGAGKLNKIYKIPFCRNQREQTLEMIINEYVSKIPGYIRKGKDYIRFVGVGQEEVPSKSIYQLICDNMTDGQLNEGFCLQKHDPSQHSWVPGARDGVTIYHMPPQRLHLKDQVEMGNALQAVSGRDYAEMDNFFAYWCNEHRAISIIKDLKNFVINNQQKLDLDAIYNAASWMLRFSINIECVKVGMELLSLFKDTDAENREIIRRLGQSDEFTFFSVLNMSEWENGNEEIFNLAKKVHGWGRIHTVDCLQPETEEIKDWLLMEGTKNSVCYTYSALCCWDKSEAQKLLFGTITCDQFDALATLIGALLYEGPVTGISSLENRNDILVQFLKQAEHFGFTEEDYDVIQDVKHMINEWKLLEELENCDFYKFTGLRLDTTGAAGYYIRENPRDPDTTVMRHMNGGFPPGMKHDLHFHGFGKHLCVENYDFATTIFPGMRRIFKDENGNEDGYFEYTGGLDCPAFNIRLGNRLLQVEHDRDGWDVLENREIVARIDYIEKENRQRFVEGGFDVETRTRFMISKDLDEELCLYIMAIPVIGW